MVNLDPIPRVCINCKAQFVCRAECHESHRLINKNGCACGKCIVAPNNFGSLERYDGPKCESRFKEGYTIAWRPKE